MSKHSKMTYVDITSLQPSKWIFTSEVELCSTPPPASYEPELWWHIEVAVPLFKPEIRLQ